MNMDSDDKSKGNNDGKDFTIQFKVFEHFDHSKRRSFLKLAKPDSEPDEVSCETNLRLGTVDYPNVCLKKESVANEHALNIMGSINHQNILSMKGIGPKKGGHFLVFTEECEGPIENRMWRSFHDEYGLPSETFRDIVSEVIEGVEFLRRNDTYHGNLSWKTTFYKHPYVVKLCNFKINDSVDKKDSQWKDWTCILQMLKEVSAEAMRLNQHPQKKVTLFCGQTDALIELIESFDRNSLHLMRNIVLDDAFFWRSGRRTRFIMTDVSELITDPAFCAEINKPDSGVCEVPWDSSSLNGSLGADMNKIFAELLDHCNSYRAKLKPSLPALDTKKKSDCVKLACIAYTHQHQEDFKIICGGRVDFIFRVKYRMIFIKLNRIIKARA